MLHTQDDRQRPDDREVSQVLALGYHRPIKTYIASPEHRPDPYPFYVWLRVESPVHAVTLPDWQTAWLVTRHGDVALALKNGVFAKEKRNILRLGEPLRQPWAPGMFQACLSEELGERSISGTHTFPVARGRNDRLLRL
jgi:cytochrome P450